MDRETVKSARENDSLEKSTLPRESLPLTTRCALKTRRRAFQRKLFLIGEQPEFVLPLQLDHRDSYVSSLSFLKPISSCLSP